MAVLPTANKTTVQVQPGGNITRISGLASGTLYGVYFVAQAFNRASSPAVSGSPGPGASLVTLSSLPSAVQTAIASFASEAGASVYPAGMFVAGASANYAHAVPQFSVDSVGSSDVTRILRVACPDFNSTPSAGLKSLEIRISRDNGLTWQELQDRSYPFPNGVNYATFSVAVPYAQNVQVVAQAFFNDGSTGPASNAITLPGFPTPQANSLAAPTLISATGVLVYSSITNTVGMTATVVATPDPLADSLKVNLVNPTDNSVKASSIVTLDPANPGAQLTAVFTNLDTSISSYNVILYSMRYGVGSTVSGTPPTITTPAASTYHPAALNPANITLTEVITWTGTALQSQIKVTWTADQTQPRANIYLRRNDNYGGDPTQFTGFTLDGSSTSQTYLSNPVTAGSTVSWDVYVAAVGVSGTEAVFATAQIKNVAVQGYANYVPPLQTLPTMVTNSADSVTLTGTYVQAPNTPAPLFINLYNSETTQNSGTLVAQVAPQPTSTPGTYAWSYTVPSLAKSFSVSAMASIVICYLLQNGIMSTPATKSVVRISTATPSTVPVISSATAYISTASATITDCTQSLTTSSGSYTPATGGNGILYTLNPPLNTFIAEVSDPGGTPGLNPQNVTPTATQSGTTAVLMFTPPNNTGGRNIRVAFVTLYGTTGWSSATQITFPVGAVVDTTPPVLTGCAPAATAQTDGSIKITWSAAAFGASGLGSYIIRRNTVNTLATSTIVGSVSTITNLTFIDYLSITQQGSLYYYWLDATNGQGIASGAPVLITGAGITSTVPVPTAPTGLTVVGGSSLFSISWAPNAERNISSYKLDFSALGTFSDTVSVNVSGTSYTQTLDGTVSTAAAGVYRWRLSATNLGGTGTACTAVAANLTNFGAVLDTPPNNLTSVSAAANTDGSITLTITGPTDANRAVFEIIRRSAAATFVDATTSGVTNEATIDIPSDGTNTAATWTDTGLNPNKFYEYRVYAKSKLVATSASYVNTTAVQAQYVVQGVVRPSLIANGGFYSPSGGWGASYNGWTLGAGVTFLAASGNYGYNSANFKTPRFTYTGVTAYVALTQTFQVIPGKKYTVLGMIYYQPTTNDGRAYIRVTGGTISEITSANGMTTPPAPYPGVVATDGTDYTPSANVYTFISYSFIAPAGVNQLTLNIGYEGKTATDSVSLYPSFLQVYQDQ